MSSAKVILKEIDRSTRVASFPGVAAGIVIPALKGPINKPTLVSSDVDLLSIFTPNDTIEVGMSNAFFSGLNYLQQGDALWVTRPEAPGVLFGSAMIKSSTSITNNATSSAGITDPTAHIFDGMPDVDGIAEITDIQTPDSSGMDVIGPGQYFELASPTTDYYVWYNVTDGANSQSDPLLAGKTAIQVDVLAADTANNVATKTAAAIDLVGDFNAPAPASDTFTVTNAAEGAVTDASDTGSSGVLITVTTQGVTEVNEVDEVLFIYGANPGAWNNDVYFTIGADITNAAPTSFLLRVFKGSNLATPVEEWITSRDPSALDGKGRNIFIETLLEGSNYIRALSNPAFADSITPKTQVSPLALGGGDDGGTITDSQMIIALDTFQNPEDIRVTLLMDGGNATPAFGQRIDQICQARQDCMGILSVPFSDEASASFMTDIVDYRSTELNLNSSYSALYTPHVKIYDKFNDRELFVAPDGYVGASISFSARNFEIWFPPAGFKRGNISALDLRRRYTTAQMDLLQESQINPIRFAPGKGIAIWGQKTLLTRASSLDRVNVRLLLITLEPLIKAALEDFLFDLNDEAEHSRAKALIDSAMEDFQARRGVTDFEAFVEGSNDPNEMVVSLFVVPTASIEKIPFNVIITRSNVEFSLS